MFWADPLIPIPPYFVWVIRVFPRHVEHVPNLLGQADPGSAVGSHVDAGYAMASGKLRSPEEQHVFLGPERTDPVGNVIANDNDIAAFWILGGLEGHFPSYHPNLQSRSRGQQEVITYVQDVEAGTDTRPMSLMGAAFLNCPGELCYQRLQHAVRAEHSWQGSSPSGALLISLLFHSYPPLFVFLSFLCLFPFSLPDSAAVSSQTSQGKQCF